MLNLKKDLSWLTNGTRWLLCFLFKYQRPIQCNTPIQKGIILHTVQEFLQPVMSLVTGMCSDNTELRQKISKLGQQYRFLPFKYCLNDHRESYSILIFFCYISVAVSCQPQNNRIETAFKVWVVSVVVCTQTGYFQKT